METEDKFSKAAQFTFHPTVEGGYTVDNGGPTNYGITQNTLDAFNRKYGYPQSSVKDMNQDFAKNIAKMEFFEEPGLNILPDRTAVAAFDYSINSGPYQAIKDLQRVVGTKPDGRMGPHTQKAIEKYIQTNGEDALLHDYTERRAILMHGLLLQDPGKYGPSIKGWANRLKNLKQYLNFSALQGDPNAPVNEA